MLFEALVVAIAFLIVDIVIICASASASARLSHGGVWALGRPFEKALRL
jgi:hypothetical protein